MAKISASILSANFTSLGSEIERLENAGADMIHIDVMDGLFVPNLTFGPPIIKQLRPMTNLPFDVHLMINAPEDSVDQYIDAGADIITIHPEASMHLDRTIRKIKNAGVKVGIALLPSTSEEVLKYIISEIDLILVMSVNPGFAGQQFIATQLEKIRNIRSQYQTYMGKCSISVDGGINEITAPAVIKAGADILVAGSYIFQSEDLKKQVLTLKVL